MVAVTRARRSWSKLIGAFALSVALLVGAPAWAGASVAPAAATKPATATISGTVQFPAGTDFAKGVTYAYVLEKVDSSQYVGRAPVQRDGSFTVSQLPAGKFYVLVMSYGRPVANVFLWGSGFPRQVTVAAGQSVTIGKIVVPRSASISGRVAVPQGVSTSKVEVRAYSSSNPSSAWALTLIERDGSFLLGGLPTGVYKLQFISGDGRMLGEWYNNKTSFSSAISVPLKTLEQKKGLNITLARASVAGSTPTISGTPAVGKKLTAKPGAWAVTPSYQWYANGKAIAKATKSTVTLTSAQRGKTITVTVTGKKAGYTTTTKTSKATAKVR